MRISNKLSRAGARGWCTPGLIALGAALTAAALTGPVMAAPSAPRPAPRPVLAAPATPAKMTSAEGAAYLLALQSAGAATFEEAKALLQQALALVPQPGLMRGRLACTLAARTYSQSVDDAAYTQEAASTASECYRLRPDDAQAQMLDGVARRLPGWTLMPSWAPRLKSRRCAMCWTGAIPPRWTMNAAGCLMRRAVSTR